MLSNLVKGDYVGVDFDEDFFFLDTAPVVMIPKATGGYAYYYYINFEGDTFWFDFDAGGPDEGTPIAAGTGIWFRQSGEDCAVTFAGQVVSDSSVPVSTTKDVWSLISNPYPMSCAISSLTYSGIVGIDFDEDFAFLETAPVLMIPKSAGGYAYYYYINFEGDTFWFDFDAGGPDEGAVIPVSSGFWFKAATDVTITFTK